MNNSSTENPATYPFVCIELARDDLVFSSAHFAQRPDGTSEPLHGHNYAVTASVAGSVDQLGYVVDFAVLKSLLRSIIHQLNHKILLPGNSERITITRNDRELSATVDGNRYVFPVSDVLILPLTNTTCEQLAAYVGGAVLAELPVGHLELKIEESPGQGASWRSSNAR